MKQAVHEAHHHMAVAPCPAGPAGTGRTFFPGDAATSAPPIVLLVKRSLSCPGTTGVAPTALSMTPPHNPCSSSSFPPSVASETEPVSAR